MQRHLGGNELPRHNTNPVTLPAAAGQAAHHFEGDKFADKFVFSTTNAHGPPSTVPAFEDLPDQAMVPAEIPPQGWPQAAESNMSETAMVQLEEHGPPSTVPAFEDLWFMG